MRLISLHEGNLDLFDSRVNRTLYRMYEENKVSFSEMWASQGTSFWLKFFITFRSVLQKKGYGCRRNYLQYFPEATFISMLKIITGQTADPLHSLIQDVLRIARYHQLVKNFDAIDLHGLSAGFEHIFGGPCERGVPLRMCDSLHIYLRFVGCLLKVLQLWLVAEPCKNAEHLLWLPPSVWATEVSIAPVEKYMQQRWGEQLFSLLNLSKADVKWWKSKAENHWAPAVVRQEELGLAVTSKLQLHLELVKQNFDVSSDLAPYLQYMTTSTLQNNLSSYIGQHRMPYVCAFNLALSRNMSIPSKEVFFHPYAQFVLSFCYSAVGPKLWAGTEGLESMFGAYRVASEENSRGRDKLSVVENVEMKDLSFIAERLRNLLGQCRLAAELNSSFYNALGESDVDWVSPITLLRLPWNIPLCLNWLEILYWQISEFEHHFHVLCHYPLKKEVVALVHEVHVTVSLEAKWLTKVCIIVAEGIFVNQKIMPGRCYGPRGFLHDALKKLAPVMKFLQQDAYEVLHFLCQTCWTPVEQQNGHAEATRGRTNIKEMDSCDMPDIDTAFSTHHRSIYYWLSSNDWPDIENGRKHYGKTVEMLRAYLEKPPVSLKKATPTIQTFNINYEVFKKCSDGALAINLNNNRDHFSFIIKCMNMLVEDGWLSKDVYTSFSLTMVEKGFVNAMMEQGNFNSDYASFRQLFDTLEKLLIAYLVLVFMMGHTWEYSIPDQTVLAMMLRSQCRTAMTNLGCYMSCLIQRSIPGHLPCPAPKYFSKAHEAVRDRCGWVRPKLDLAGVRRLVATLHEPVMTRVDTDQALQRVEVPYVDDLTLELVSEWIVEIRHKRVQLMQLVVDMNWSLSRRFSRKLHTMLTTFPCQDELEFRFVEELAGLRKALQMGMGQQRQMFCLMELLAMRFTWLQDSYTEWSEKYNFTPFIDLPPFDTPFHNTIKVKVCTMAASIPLQAIFHVYLSRYCTLHPISMISLDLLQDLQLKLYHFSCGIDGTDMSQILDEYVETLQKMGPEYLRQMLRHCMAAWKVPFLLHWDPDQVQVEGSLNHGIQILSAFTQLVIILSYNMLLQGNPDLFSKMDNLANLCVQAWVCMLVGQMQPVEDWYSVTVMEASTHFYKIWHEIVKLRDEWKLINVTIPEFCGDISPIWNSLFEVHRIHGYNLLLKKLNFTGFYQIKCAYLQVEQLHLNCGEEGMILPGTDCKELTASRNDKDEAEKAVESGASGACAVPLDKMSCSGCSRKEGPEIHLRVCGRCVKENRASTRSYCSKDCQVVDWSRRHRVEHKVIQSS